MASRQASASKTTQQKMALKIGHGGSGDLRVKQKRGLEPETLVGLQSEPAQTQNTTNMLLLEAGDRMSSNGESQSTSRASLGSRYSSSLGQAPSRSNSSLSQRVGTPTKCVSLTAVKRKEESEGPIEPELDWREYTHSNSSMRFGVRSSSQTSFSQSRDGAGASGVESSVSSFDQSSESGYSSKADTVHIDEITSKMQAATLETGEKEGKSADVAKNSDDDDSDDLEPESEARKAPNELFMEFLDCLMTKDFVNAEKLCRMILIYEPNNPQAKEFHPVILEKLQLDKEAEENNNEGNSNDSEDGADDDDDDDDDDDSEDDSSSADTSNDDDDEVIAEEYEDDEGPPRPDSGIGM